MCVSQRSAVNAPVYDTDLRSPATCIPTLASLAASVRCDKQEKGLSVSDTTIYRVISLNDQQLTQNLNSPKPAM